MMFHLTALCDYALLIRGYLRPLINAFVEIITAFTASFSSALSYLLGLIIAMFDSAAADGKGRHFDRRNEFLRERGESRHLGDRP